MANTNFNFGDTNAWAGTSRIGYLEPLPWTFDETVGRIITLTGQKPERGDKVEFDFVGTYKGHAFTLYDYKCDGQIHIGGTRETAVLLNELKAALLEDLKMVVPAEYTYRPSYGEW